MTYRVEDTGIGIPQDRQVGLFDAFTAGDASYTRNFDGTGLGLATSKALIDAMHGSIGVSSRAGCGTVLRFELPLEEGLWR